MSTAPSEPKPRRFSRRTLIIGLILIPLLCICGFIATLFNDPATDPEPTVVAEIEQPIVTDDEASEMPATIAEPTTPPIATQTSQPTQTTRATDTLEPTAVPQPTDTLTTPNIGELRDLSTDELALQNTIDQAFGESNRGLGRKLNLFSPGLPGLIENSIIIGWAADEATSPALVREAMARDTLTVLQAVTDSGIDYDAVLIGAKYPMMIEQLNMVDEVEVLTLQYDRDTLAAIDWNTITPSEIFQIADLFIIHPDFEE